MTKTQVHSLTRSYWHRDLPVRQQFDSLSTSHRTEVLVIGAGITGLTTALELVERGHQVTVCEAEAIGSGTTAASTGHLDAHPEFGATKLIDKLGLEGAKQYTRLRLTAIDRIEQIAADTSDFKRIDAFQYSEKEADLDSLRKDCEAAQQIGLLADWTDDVPIAKASGGYRIESMARINTALYLKRLTQLAVERGVTIFEKTMVTGVTRKGTTSLGRRFGLGRI